MSQSRKDFLKTTALGSITAIAGLNFTSASKAHIRRKPYKLAKGDTIGMISPASSLSDETAYANVAKEIKKLGFNVTIGPHAKDHYGYFAGTDEDRAEDLNAMFADYTIDAILPFRGGWGANRILEYINYDLIKENPKPLIGYSDITALLLAIYAKTGLITFHGPVGSSSWTDFTWHYFEKALMQTAPYTMTNTYKTPNLPENALTTITEGQATGILLGGNLTVLTAMLGSNYTPDWEDSLLFLEDVGEDIYRIDRMLTQLRLNGIFEKINGFIFGKCSGCDEANGFHFTLEQIVEDHIKEFMIPAYVGANIGHIDDMFTLPVGIQAEMNANRGIITLLESSVKSDT